MYYRNLVDVTSIEGIEVDAGSLWKKEKGQLVLVDKDQFATHKQTKDFIEQKKDQ